jgi:hypothetical protein
MKLIPFDVQASDYFAYSSSISTSIFIGSYCDDDQAADAGHKFTTLIILIV